MRRVSTAPGPCVLAPSRPLLPAGRPLALGLVELSGVVGRKPPGPVRWAPGGVCARQPCSPAPPKLLGPQLLPSAWKPSQAWAGTAAPRDGLYSWVENAASFFWGASVPIMLGHTMELNLISFSNRA